MNLYFVVNRSKEMASQVALQAAQLLTQAGARCFVTAAAYEEAWDQWLVPVADETAAVKSCDIIITVGGDGTILHTVARLGSGESKPILGINVGRMGFLATIEPTELDSLGRLLTGEYLLDERSLLDAQLSEEGGPGYTVLNDVVIGKGAVNDTIRCTVYCDGTQVGSYRGDGVIIATPTGSTAYSLSAGGPVLDAKSNGMVMTPISAHSLNTPSMVFAADRQLKIEISENDHRTACFSADGTNCIRLQKEDTVYVRQSKRKIRLICFKEADQLRTIDKKLKGR